MNNNPLPLNSQATKMVATLPENPVDFPLFLNRFQTWAISQGIWRYLKGTAGVLPQLAQNASFETKLKYRTLEEHIETKKGLAFTILQSLCEKKPYLIRPFLPNVANPDGDIAGAWTNIENHFNAGNMIAESEINNRITAVVMLPPDSTNKVNRFLQCVGEFNAIYETAIHQNPQIQFSENQKINNLIKVIPADFHQSSYIHVARDGVTFENFCTQVRALLLTDEVQIATLFSTNSTSGK